MSTVTHCLCIKCQTERLEPLPLTMQAWRMPTCPDCGFKRCPKATDHNLDCTGSNEPGQEGSAYGPPPCDHPFDAIHTADNGQVFCQRCRQIVKERDE